MHLQLLNAKQGNDIVSLLTFVSHSAESHLLHHPNMNWTKLQVESMNIPELIAQINSDETENELIEIEKLLISLKKNLVLKNCVWRN